MAEEDFEEMIMDMEETASVDDVAEEDYSDPLTGHIVQFVKDKFSKAETARQLDEEANGYKTARANAYPQLAEQLDKLFHDIDGGLLGEDAKTGSLYLALKEVKDDNPKPSE